MRLEFSAHLYRKFLSVVPFFRGLPQEVLTTLCTIMEPMLAVHGQVIYTQGSSGTEMYMLLSGELEITIINQMGSSQRLGFLSDGAFFGETYVTTARVHDINPAHRPPTDNRAHPSCLRLGRFWTTRRLQRSVVGL